MERQSVPWQCANRPCNFAESKYFAAREVTNGDTPIEGDQVVLAQGVQVDVLHHDHLVVLLVKHALLDHTYWHRHDTLFSSHWALCKEHD